MVLILHSVAYVETASEVGLNGKLIICDSVLILGAILIIHGLRGVLMLCLDRAYSESFIFDSLYSFSSNSNVLILAFA